MTKNVREPNLLVMSYNCASATSKYVKKSFAKVSTFVIHMVAAT